MKLLTFGKLLVFDFDGVLCDSATELFWGARPLAQRLWPDNFTELNRDITNCNEEGYSARELTYFRRLRPLLEFGFQAPLLVLVSRVLAYFNEDLQLAYSRLREIFSNLTVEYHPSATQQSLESLLLWLLDQPPALPRHEIDQQLTALRQQLLDHNPTQWLAYNTPYPSIVATLQGYSNRSDLKLAVISTKPKQLLNRLIQAWGLPFTDELVFGLEAGAKELVLLELISGYNLNPTAVSFIEDRLETLLRISQNPLLSDLQLYLASWGYVTTEQLIYGKKHSKIKVVELAELSKIV